MADPRYRVLPGGIVSSGWPSIRDVCGQVGITFDPWQQELNRAILALDSGGLYAADTVGLSVCRQAGKTFDVGGLIFGDSLKHPGTTTVWTAHRFKVARESFEQLRGLASLPRMAPHIDVDAITTAAGNESIPFRNGSRILFAARERGAIRGFAKVRRLVLDEAQHLVESAMADLAPTMNHAWNPQIILMGTPPSPKDGDRGDTFRAMRAAALAGESDGQLWVEFGADPGDDLEDWATVEKANPSFPGRTSRRAINRLRKLITDEGDRAREIFGIWDAESAGAVIGPEVWAKFADPESKRHGSRVVFAVDVAPDHKRASIVVAAPRRDGRIHVEVVPATRGGLPVRSGTAWVVPRMVELLKRWPGAEFVLDPSGAAGSLLADLAEHGISPRLVSGREMTQACGLFFTAVTQEDRVRHLGQPELAGAVDAGRKQQRGEAWRWRRVDVSADITHLVAATLAVYRLTLPAGKRQVEGEAAFF